MIHELSFKFHWTRWIWLFKYRQRGFCVEEGRLFMKMDPEEDYQFIIPAWEIFWNTIPCYVLLTKMIQDFRIDYYFTRLRVICPDHLDISVCSNTWPNLCYISYVKWVEGQNLEKCFYKQFRVSLKIKWSEDIPLVV